MALYNLAVFHDNNGREAAAIVHYQRALTLGLDRATEVRALAWLASSLYKMRRLAVAGRCVKRALATPCPPELRRFLIGLESQICRAQKL
jgi:hypothetical protein